MRSLVFIFFYLFFISSSQADGIKVGMWELRSEIYIGIPLVLKDSKVENKCLKADYLEKMGNQISSLAEMIGECRELSKKIRTNHLAIQFSCESKDITMVTSYNIRVDGESLVAEHVASGSYKGNQGMEKTKILGKYIGSCRQ